MASQIPFEHLASALHPPPLSLAQLDALSNEDIVTLGNRDFLEKEAHPWIRDLWVGETPSYEVMAANVNLGVEPEEGPEDLDPEMTPFEICS